MKWRGKELSAEEEQRFLRADQTASAAKKTHPRDLNALLIRAWGRTIDNLASPQWTELVLSADLPFGHRELKHRMDAVG